jgi:hypothetical protein
MSNPRTHLAEALAILGTLAATAKGQQIERLEVEPSTRQTFPLRVSEDGEWIAGLDFGNEYGIAPVRWRRGSAALEMLAEYSTSGVGLVTIANDGRVFGQDINRRGAWTSVGFVAMYPDESSFETVTPDGRFAVVNRYDVWPYANWVYDGSNPILRLATPAEGGDFRASGMSADARIIAGTEYRDATIGNSTSSRYFPIRWVNGQFLRLPFGGGWSVSAWGMSTNGNVIGGSSREGFDSEGGIPIIWVGGADPIVVGPRGGSAIPLSSDGRVVKVNRGIWTPEAGYRSQIQFLVAMGLREDDLPSVNIIDSSGDATVLSATLNSDQMPSIPIRITLPPPCHLDYATDGMVDFFDYVAFVACFEGDCPNYRSADFNMDGFVDWADYAGFVEAFEIGC